MEDIVKEFGFDSLEEFNHLVSMVDLTMEEKFKKFTEWRETDYTKEGLLKLILMENKEKSLTEEDKNFISELIKGIQHERRMKLTSIGVPHNQKSISKEKYLYVADLEINVLENILNKIDLYVIDLGNSIQLVTFDEVWKFEYMQLKDIIKNEINSRNIMNVLEPEYKEVLGTFMGGQIIQISNDSKTFIDPFNIDLNKENYNCVLIGSLGDGAKCNNYIKLCEMGEGKGIHPWDNLKSCECGGSPWMDGKNGGNFEEGEPYRIRCCKCGKHTKDGNLQDVKNEWNI